MIMKQRNALILAFITIGLLFFASPVSGALKDIPTGGTVFIGEQGLDISGPIGSVPVSIGWWASGASIAGSSPIYTVNVATPNNFYVSPTEFSTRTGSWYVLPAKTLAFNVADPQLGIIIEDTTVNVDVTDKWVPTGDELRFRIDTNLYPISGRTGQSSTPVTIKVQSPEGALFSALISNSGVTTSIVDYPVTTTPHYTGSIWGTSNRGIYPPGTYTIWAECNVNSMKDNYGVEGKTISRKVSLLNQDQNPLIRGNVQTTNPTLPTTTLTTKVTTLSTPKPSTPQNTPLPALTTPQALSAPPTTAETAVSPQPFPIKTKTAGFEAILAGLALIAGLVFYTKKK
jgi:hypothetical protein